MTETMVARSGDPSTTETTAPSGSPKGRKPVEKRWILVVVIWLSIFLLVLFVLHKYTENNQGPFVHLLSSGEASQLNPARHQQLANLVRQTSHDFKADVPVLIYEKAEERIDASFDQLQQAVNEYLEWHFSTTASYTRLFISMTDDLDEWAANKIGEKLADASGYTQAMESLTNDFPKIQTNFILNEFDKLRLEVDDFLNTHGSVVEQSDLPPETPLLDLSQLVRSSDLPLELDVIVASANVGKVTSASVGIVGAAAGSPAVRAAMADVKRFRNRAVGQAVKSGAKGAARTAATSFTGPYALGIGVAVLATDAVLFARAEYIALNAQETLHRPKMEKELREFIESKREETKTAYRAASEVAVNRAVDLLLADIAAQEEMNSIKKSYRIVDLSSWQRPLNLESTQSQSPL